MLKALKFLLLCVICVFVMFSALIFGFKDHIISSLAPANMDEALIPDAASQFLDRKGNVIYTTLSVERRIPITIDKIPKHVQHAFIAIEDNRFYDHSGIDFRGTARAVVSTLSGREVQGGSTITQQLAKNAFLTQERTISRKIREAFLSMALESKYTKEEILCMYLNRIYFGNGAYGLESASHIYFNKATKDLTLAQAAALAAIPKSPNYFNPFANPKDSKARQELVLDQMAKYGFINSDKANAAKKDGLGLATQNKTTNSTPESYFYEMIVQQVIDILGADALYKDGLKIYTTIDMDMQRAANDSLSVVIDSYAGYSSANKKLQVALAAVEPKTGAVRAMLGGRGGDKFNRAYLATRQPGSAFKPFVYAAAMANGFSPASVIEDKEEDFGGGWKPRNSDWQEHGKVSLRTALVKSINIPTVKIARAVGVEKVIQTAEAMGISTLVDNGKYNDTNLAMSLGGLTKGVNPLEMAGAYAVFANNGVYVKPYSIDKIVDRSGKVLYQHKKITRDAIRAKDAYLVTNMLQDVLVWGTAGGAGIGRPAAGKTGTTDSSIDAWFVGYTPDLSTAVWCGYDDNTSMGRMYGSGAPLDTWYKFMVNAHRNLPVSYFYNPGVVVPPEPEIKQDPKDKDKDKDGKDKNDPNAKDNKDTKAADGSVTNAPAPQQQVETKTNKNKKSLKERLKEAKAKK